MQDLLKYKSVIAPNTQNDLPLLYPYFRIHLICFLLLMFMSHVVSAQYTNEKAGNYNSDYERNRREAARQAEAQNARNRQPNSPAARSTYGNTQKAATSNNAPKYTLDKEWQAKWDAEQKVKAEQLSRSLDYSRGLQAPYRALYETYGFTDPEVWLHSLRASFEVEKGKTEGLVDSIMAKAKVKRVFEANAQTATFEEMNTSIQFMVSRVMPISAQNMIRQTLIRFPEKKEALVPTMIQNYHIMASQFYFRLDYDHTDYRQMLDEFFVFDAATPGVYRAMYELRKGHSYDFYRLVTDKLYGQKECEECFKKSERKEKAKRWAFLNKQQKELRIRDGVK